MQAFLKSVKSPSNSRESAVRSSITTQLSDVVKEIQLYNIEDQDNAEAKTTLCSVVEAMFLHGLKDTIAHKFRRALADVDERPEPSFWSPLLVISHRQIIDQIAGLTQIVTEIGQCRSWIRLALNDALLSSYLMTIRQDPSALKPYYNTFAYIRDIDELELAQKLIEGVEAIQLEVPCNSSILNTWTLPTLLLAGIWSPTLRATPIAVAVDVAQSIHATSSANSDTCSLNSMVSQNSSLFQLMAINQDEALKIILAQHSDEGVQEALPIPEAAPEAEPIVDTPESSVQASSLGNSLNRHSGWSFDENHVEDVEENNQESQVDVLADSTKSMEHSFNALIENSYNIFAGTHIRTPDFREVLQKLEPQKEIMESPSKKTNDVPPVRNQSLALATQVHVIAKEKGLDSQDYTCSSCKEMISLETKCPVCAFTGEYFCNTCMAAEKIAIPARIIHNWDFKTYPVSQRAFNCLEEIKDHPTIDFKIVNPYIYTAVAEMGKLQILRNQLNYLRAYLYTCKELIIEELQKQMWPREYMYEHIHQYSISDLLEIKDGHLARQLKKVVEFGTDHVLKCWVCQQKGFLCELCEQSKLLFPFDVDNVYRCNLCSGVYHKSCLNALKPCPRCKRKKERDNLQLLEATLD